MCVLWPHICPFHSHQSQKLILKKAPYSNFPLQVFSISLHKTFKWGCCSAGVPELHFSTPIWGASSCPGNLWEVINYLASLSPVDNPPLLIWGKVWKESSINSFINSMGFSEKKCACNETNLPGPNSIKFWLNFN